MAYNGYKVYDGHAHIFPDKIAHKAAESIGAFYGYDMHHRGRAGRLELIRVECGVEGVLVSSVATSPEQVTHINDFMVQQKALYPHFITLGSMHPDFAGYEKELERIKALGLYGVKLHSDFQKFDIDDPKMDKVYAKIVELGLPVLFHMGDKRFNYSHPARLARVLEKFPDMVCTAAHFGGWSVWEDVPESLAGSNCYFDTSSTLEFLDDYTLPIRLLEKFGADRFMFGTDYPMWDFRECFDNFMKLPLDDAQREKIFYKNFERLYGLDK